MTPLPPAPDSTRLLENGEAYFSRVCEAIAHARQSELVETFILSDDKAGKKLHATLLAAVRRRVRVAAAVDGFGPHGLRPEFGESG